MGKKVNLPSYLIQPLPGWTRFAFFRHYWRWAATVLGRLWQRRRSVMDHRPMTGISGLESDRRGSSDASGREVTLDVKAAEDMHVASANFMGGGHSSTLQQTLPKDGLTSPDPLVAIAEMASEHLAPTHWLLCKVRYVLSCFYEKSQRPALADNLQGILDLEKRILGRNSPGKLEQKGDQLMMKGDLPQAFDCYAQVLKTQSPDLQPGSSPQCEEMRRKLRLSAALRSVLDAAKTDGYPGKA
eukprot:s830_g34.t1